MREVRNVKQEPRIDGAQITAMQRTLERMGGLTAEVEYWKIKVAEEKEATRQLLQRLQEAGVDLESILKPPEDQESESEGPGEPESTFPVSPLQAVPELEEGE
jgi:hypothetical protein